MKIVKPLSLGLLHKPHRFAGRHRLVVVALGFFTLGQPVGPRLLGEAKQWPKVIPALAHGQPLDEIMPKAQAEALVLGEPGLHSEQPTAVRLQVAGLDKRLRVQARPGVPAGFGPLPISDPLRHQHAGTYDEQWRREDWPGLPRDVDWRLFNQAPEDQRIEASAFDPGAPYRLEGMSAETLEGTLPAQRVRAFVRPQGSAPQALVEVPLGLDTIWFVPAQALGVVAWRGQVEVADSDALDVHALMLAYEDSALAALPLAHYAQVLELRLAPATAGLHALNESQIAPALPVEVAADDTPQRQARLDAADAEFWRQAGRKPPPDRVPPRVAAPLIEGPSPQALARGDVDLSPLMAQVDALHEKTLAQAEKLRAATSAKIPTAPAALRWADVLARAEAVTAPLLAQARNASPTPLSLAAVLPPDMAQALGRQVLQWLAQGVPLAGRDLAGADLRGASLAGADLRGCQLEYADLRGADLSGCNLSGAALTQARFDGALLADADLSSANLCGSSAEHAQMPRAKLAGARASKARWAGVQAAGAELTRAILDEADLAGACFDGACLDQAVLGGATLRGSQWRGAQANRLIAWKLQAAGADFSHTRWHRCALLRSDLRASRWDGARFLQFEGGSSDWRGASLRGARAQRSGWPGAQLQGADLREAGLVQCDFSRARLDEAALQDACLARSVFMQATLPRSDARNADFFQALLRKADFTGSDLREASFFEAHTAEMQLQDAHGVPA
jgi:uncharacterized protein YjbI with pentapeptide repeats